MSASHYNLEVFALSADGVLSDATSHGNNLLNTNSFSDPNRSFIISTRSPMKKPSGEIQTGNFSTPHGSFQDMLDSIGVKKATSPSPPAKNKHNYQYIIGVSANSDPDTIQEAFVAGVDAFIPKPFTVQMFNSTFSKLRTLRKSEGGSIEE